MGIEHQVRQALTDLASDTPSTDRLATTALRRARRRRYAARTAVVGSAAAVVALPASVLAIADLDLRSDPASVGPAASGPQDETAPAPADQADQADQTDIEAAPTADELGGDELQAAFDTCRESAEGGYAGWEPAFGITVEADAEGGVPTTWIAARRGDHVRADCVLDSAGQLVMVGGTYGAKSTPALLYAPVDGQEGAGVGRYVDPVAQVTVQYEGEAERAAVLHNGFWFTPMDPNRLTRSQLEDAPDREAAVPGIGDHDLIGVPPGYTFRGYDASGELVYDSSADGPSVEDCYADPAGEEFVGNWAGHDDPAECVPTHRWVPTP